MTAQTQWEMVAGLEIHARIRTQTKMFCPCKNTYGDTPNTQICAICTGQPGALPVLNQEALALALKTGKALKCSLREHTHCDRKSYFYPDLPMGYQISQFDEPVAQEGSVSFMLDGSEHSIRIERLHIENDAGKLTHVGSSSLADYNRAGSPLMEIVTHADFRSAEQVGAFLRELQKILRAIGSSDADMEKGQMRCDVNISLRPQGQEEFGTKTELKNMNSFRYIEDAIAVEIARQQKLLDAGEAVVQETRGYDPATRTSTAQRAKETAADYKYFPDPDIPPLILTPEFLAELMGDDSSVELPSEKKARYESLGISSDSAQILSSDPALSAYLDAMLQLQAPAKRSANWLLGDFSRELKSAGLTPDSSPYPPEHLTALISLVEEKKLPGQAAQDLFSETFLSGLDPLPLIEERGLIREIDSSELEAWIQEAIAANPSAVESYRAGKEKALGAILGNVMKLSQGSADPSLVRTMVIKILSS